VLNQPFQQQADGFIFLFLRFALSFQLPDPEGQFMQTGLQLFDSSLPCPFLICSEAATDFLSLPY
jgi:hypothetical protein